MLEILDLQEMNEIKGGANEANNYCDSLQKMASGSSKDWSDADWDKWAKNFEANCVGAQ